MKPRPRLQPRKKPRLKPKPRPPLKPRLEGELNEKSDDTKPPEKPKLRGPSLKLQLNGSTPTKDLTSTPGTLTVNLGRLECTNRATAGTRNLIQLDHSYRLELCCVDR
jgi:hypothetical protein